MNDAEPDTSRSTLDDDDSDHHDESSASMHMPGQYSSFAERCLYVIQSIPTGKVFSYGMVAELAGAPRHAREVGRMLAERLCAGGAPWWRVISASGKISLRPGSGGIRQRKLLEEEGVQFRLSGRVESGSFWVPEQPDEEFFIGWGR
mgnify:CR=1 FL=1